MSASNDKLKKAMFDAKEAFVSDTSVSPAVTLDALEELQSDLDTTIEAIRQDMKRNESTK